MENNETIFESVYPLTIVSDRYNGTYSHGKFTAWNCESDEVPTAIFGDDVTCMKFWIETGVKNCFDDYLLFGIGDTVEEAVGNLYVKLKGEQKKTSSISNGIPYNGTFEQVVIEGVLSEDDKCVNEGVSEDDDERYSCF